MKLRVGSYNVEFSKSTSAEEVGRMLRPFRLDLVGFCEVPDGEWTARAGREMGLEHAFVGAVSSAHHVNKYKSILSRAPLVRTGEVYVQVAGGWNPASVVEADMRFGEVPVRFHSLHVCSCGLARGHAHLVADEVLRHEAGRCTIAVGDYNCHLGDGDMDRLEAAGFRSAWRDLPLDTTSLYTYNAFNPQQSLGVIDHILYSRACPGRVVDGGIIELEKPLSDHKPIWAEFEFPGASQ